jgi:hypothetical protein
MKVTIKTLTLFVLFLLAQPVYATQFHWMMESPGFIEPPMRYMIGWRVNEVPRNITIYYDLDGNGTPEIVFAHPIIAENHAPKCGAGIREEEQYHKLMTTCPSEHPVDYFITHQFSMFRLLSEERWSRIFMMVKNVKTQCDCPVK